MSDMIWFPKTIEEFFGKYSFRDDQEVYTNGVVLIPLFRVKQALDHYQFVTQAHWEKRGTGNNVVWICSYCGRVKSYQTKYCQHCGSRMNVEVDDE